MKSKIKLIFAKTIALKLHILRHAKTNQSSPTGLDIDRELLEKGTKQANKMAIYLEENEIENIDIHCSSSKRTRETFDIIATKIRFKSIHLTQELYLSSHLDLLNYVNQLTTNSDLMLIGHNNGLSDFVTYLTGEFIDLKTCEYCCLEIKIDSWSELSKELATIISSYRPLVD